MGRGRKSLASARRIRDAVEESNIKLLYAENWVYAPAVQKEVEIIKKTKAQLLWIRGEESHSGSHSDAYGVWNKAGGGSIVGKGCHPLTAACCGTCVMEMLTVSDNETPTLFVTVKTAL